MTWCSPIYHFFKSDGIYIQYHDSCLCHFFPCAASQVQDHHWKVHCFQDSKDKSLSANLKHHAIQCFADEDIQNAISSKAGVWPSASIFLTFHSSRSAPVQYSHQAHTNPEVQYTCLQICGITILTFILFHSAHLLKWITETTGPTSIIQDQELCELLTAGWPNIEIPSPDTISWDIKASFDKCCECIAKVLQVCWFFACICMDLITNTTGTSWVFTLCHGWLGPLQTAGHLLLGPCILDVKELWSCSFLISWGSRITQWSHPCTGIPSYAWALPCWRQSQLFTSNFFCHQLINHPHQMLAFTGDNATLDDTKTAELRKRKNSFNLWNQHLLFQPYSPTLKWSSSFIHLPCVSLLQQPMMRHPFLNTSNDDGEDSDVDDVEDEDDPLAEDGDNINDDINDGVGWTCRVKWGGTRQGSWGDAAVKHTITNVSHINLSHLQYLTTSSLGSTTCIHNHPLHNDCIAGMVAHFQRQIPQAKSNSLGSTQWNSTYDMLSFVVKYQNAIDSWWLTNLWSFRSMSLIMMTGRWCKILYWYFRFVHHAHMISISQLMRL